MSVITISRQFGAGGKTMGEKLARKLNYTFVDNEIIQMVAQKAKVSTNWVESLEKEAGSTMLKFISQLVPKSLVERVLDEKRGYIDEEVYVDLLNKIIVQIAAEDSVIILGRGGQYILKDHPGTYHILLIADHADRVRFMEKHYNLTHAQAVAAVNNEDKRRINLYRKFGKKDYNKPDHYHVVINMSRLSLDKATELVCELLAS